VSSDAGLYSCTMNTGSKHCPPLGLCAVLVEAGGRALASSANSTFARRPYHRVVVKGRRCRCWWWSAGAAAACSREGGERAAAGSRAGITL